MTEGVARSSHQWGRSTQRPPAGKEHATAAYGEVARNDWIYKGMEEVRNSAFLTLPRQLLEEEESSGAPRSCRPE